MAIDIKKYELGPLEENTYLLTDLDTSHQAVIDPGYYGKSILSDINNIDSVKYVILTHGHFDHYYCANQYLDQFPNAKLIAPLKDKYLISQGSNTEFSSMGYRHPACPPVDEYVTEDNEINLGNSIIKFIETPGHTEGGMCILVDNSLFSGDTLFRLSVGNTSFETGSFETLINSIKNKLYTLNDDVVVYPGHGINTTIGYEKRGNPFV